MNPMSFRSCIEDGGFKGFNVLFERMVLFFVLSFGYGYWYLKLMWKWPDPTKTKRMAFKPEKRSQEI